MKKAIFIRMPRCGSTSLINFCKENNIKYYGGRDMGFWGNKKNRKNNTSQHLYECVSNYVGKEIYDESFTFSSVRNPYSRAVSMYMHWSWSSAKSFKNFCNAIKKQEYPSEAAKWHSSSIAEHIVDKDTLKVDFVNRLENFQEDFDALCGKIGVGRQKLIHKNKSKHKHYTEYYDDETREIIAERYAQDIELFGYEFGG